MTHVTSQIKLKSFSDFTLNMIQTLMLTHVTSQMKVEYISLSLYPEYESDPHADSCYNANESRIYKFIIIP